MKRGKTKWDSFYSGHSLVEYPAFNEKIPPEDGRVCKGDDGSRYFSDVTIYPGWLFEYAYGTGKA